MCLHIHNQLLLTHYHFHPQIQKYKKSSLRPNIIHLKHKGKKSFPSSLLKSHHSSKKKKRKKKKVRKHRSKPECCHLRCCNKPSQTIYERHPLRRQNLVKISFGYISNPLQIKEIGFKEEKHKYGFGDLG
jgi:hypothetical protein